MNKKILVSGCAGFLGSHLTRRLLDESHIVTGIDNLSMGKIEFIKPLKKFPNFNFINIDINHLFIHDYLLDEHDFDVIFHLAANSDISKSDPCVEYMDTFSTTIKLLEYARIYEIKEFVFASSGSVYGEAYKTGKLIAEDFAPLVPISHYGSAKLASEAFISAYSFNYGIRSFICRLPNVIGSHATHGVILDFIKKIKANPDEMEVLGNGTQNKPYMHVKDVIDAMLFIWQKAKDDINCYNIAGPDTTSVNKIADMVIKAMQANTKIRYTGGDRGWKSDSPRYRPDTSKLAQLGYFCNKPSDIAVHQSINEILNELR